MQLLIQRKANRSTNKNIMPVIACVFCYWYPIGGTIQGDIAILKNPSNT